MSTPLKTDERTAILSGRYEIVHPGHIHTIRREAKRFEKLYVYVVQNDKALTPSWWAQELIGLCTIDLGNVICVLDKTHFGYATEDDLARLPQHDIFLSANPQVSEHLRGLGERVEYIELTGGYSSTDLKEGLLREAVTAWREKTGK